MDKAPGAFKTIGDLSAELGVAQHILRYWETKIPQLRPLQRAGNRRYYRPDDVALARRINGLLNEQGYTIRGVQKLLRERGAESGREPADAARQPIAGTAELAAGSAVDVRRLVAIRDRLISAID